MKPDLQKHPVPEAYIYLGRGDEIPEELKKGPLHGILYYSSLQNKWVLRAHPSHDLVSLDYYAALTGSSIVRAMHLDKFIVGATYKFINTNGLYDNHNHYNIGDRFTVEEIESDGDAFTEDGHCVMYRRLHNGELRLISTSDEEKEKTMNMKETYQQMQEAFLEANPVGTRVRILRGWSDEEAAMYGVPEQRDANSSGEATIRKTHNGSYGTAICLDNYSVYPCFVLEPIETRVQVRLNSDFDAEVTPSGIIVGCQTFSLGVIDDLVEARNRVQGES